MDTLKNKCAVVPGELLSLISDGFQVNESEPLMRTEVNSAGIRRFITMEQMRASLGSKYKQIQSH